MKTIHKSLFIMGIISICTFLLFYPALPAILPCQWNSGGVSGTLPKLQFLLSMLFSMGLSMYLLVKPPFFNIVPMLLGRFLYLLMLFIFIVSVTIPIYEVFLFIFPALLPIFFVGVGALAITLVGLFMNRKQAIC